MPGATVLSEPLRHLIATSALRRGEPPEALAARAHIAWSAMPRRAPIEALHRTWELVARGQRRAWPVDVAQALPLERLGPFGFALLSARSGADALRFAARAYPWINQRARWTLTLGASALLRLDASTPGEAGEAVSEVAMVSHILLGVRRLLADAPRPRRVRFCQPAPRYADDLSARLDVAVVWDAPVTEIELDRAPFEATLAQGCPETHSVLCGHIEAELATLARSRLGRMVSARDRAVDLAAQVRVSDRTLRRRFAAEGTTFREARDAGRAERALTLLGDPERSVTEVALELGFADVSAFARAFRRWHGASPTALRRRDGSEPT